MIIFAFYILFITKIHNKTCKVNHILYIYDFTILYLQKSI